MAVIATHNKNSWWIIRAENHAVRLTVVERESVPDGTVADEQTATSPQRTAVRPTP